MNYCFKLCLVDRLAVLCPKAVEMPVRNILSTPGSPIATTVGSIEYEYFAVGFKQRQARMWLWAIHDVYMRLGAPF